jgi:hypothetical protein
VSGENYIRRSLMICIPYHLLFKKNEMNGTCGACGKGERCLQGFGVETWGKRPLEKPRRGWKGNIKMDL